MMRPAKRFFRVIGRVLCILLAGCASARAQAVSPLPAPASQADLDVEIRSLAERLDQTQADLAESRAEVRQLRALLDQVLQRMDGRGTTAVSFAERPGQAGEGPADSSHPAAPQENQSAPQIAEDDWQVVNARLEEQNQDKVESRLKYRLKLSGIVLFNAFGVSGQVDNLDVPTTAIPRPPDTSSGSVGASLRQSILGISGFGPTILGARTSGDVQMDFFGGLPYGYGAQTSGLVRLRTARIRFDWTNTSVIAGLDAPFFSPNTPTSYLSVAVPGFASAGHLWTWTPTIRVEQRFDTSLSRFKVEAGVMDPTSYYSTSRSQRMPTPGESSRQPTYALRISANGRDDDRLYSFGLSGIYTPQSYGGETTVSGWGGTADWKIWFFKHLELRGEIFGGKGLDGFGGVPDPVVPPDDYTYYLVAPDLARITMIGGWSQLKVRVNSRSEFNFAAGTGGRNAGDLRMIAPLDPALGLLSPRNDMLFFNYVFRPRSDLVFSPEFRRLRTYQLSGAPAIANQFGLSAGFLF